jgi:membrane fusion protein (multidrug efflux system)
MSDPNEPLYRSEALEHFRWRGAEGEVLRSASRAVHYAYVSIVVFALIGLSFIALGELNRYSSGPMVVRVDGKAELSALSPGTVALVYAQPGQRVERGQVLVRFRTDVLEGELARLRGEYEDSVRRRLRDPTDAQTGAALVPLRSALELAERRLAEQSLLAPEAGVVTDVRVRTGQLVSQGDSLITISSKDATASVIAMVPAYDRSRLRVGGPLRVELRGFRYAYRAATITSIGDEAVGPREVKRYLGPELADTVEIAGPVVLIEARLPGASFEAEGQTLRYIDGMSGTADALVRREKIAVMLVPALRALFEEGL